MGVFVHMHMVNVQRPVSYYCVVFLSLTTAVCHSQLGWDCQVLESSPVTSSNCIESQTPYGNILTLFFFRCPIFVYIYSFIANFKESFKLLLRGGGGIAEEIAITKREIGINQDRNTVCMYTTTVQICSYTHLTALLEGIDKETV